MASPLKNILSKIIFKAGKKEKNDVKRELQKISAEFYQKIY
jgi:hypothetical protein